MNLSQKLNNNLSGKVMEGTKDVNILDRACNYNVRSKLEDRQCMYDKNCRRKMVVYNLKCLITSKSYVGKMQRAIKTCTKGHINNIWKIIKSGRKSLGLTGMTVEGTSKQMLSQSILGT